MLKKLLFGIAFIAFVVVAAFTVAISSDINNFADSKLTNIEVLADTEISNEQKCALIGTTYCEYGEGDTYISIETFNSDQNYYLGEGFILGTICVNGCPGGVYFIKTTWGCCS